MGKNNVEVSLQEEMQNLGQAIRRVTAAAFAGQPGVAGNIKGRRKSAQFTFRVSGANDKRSIESQARRKILGQIFAKDAAKVERVIRHAMEAVVAGLIGAGDANVRVLGRTLGRAQPRRQIEQEPFAKFIKSKAGAGEIGLPDPDESLRQLKAALLQSITVDVVVRQDGPQIKFVFDQTRLLKLTPHPHRFESGVKGPFFSWLSLVTGPDFVSNTPGYSLVRASDIKNAARKIQSKNAGSATKVSLRRADIAAGMLQASRTRGNAGELAGLMLRNKARTGGRSPAEVFGGSSGDYSPSSRFKGFWDIWWNNNKLELGIWARRVMSSTARSLLRG